MRLINNVYWYSIAIHKHSCFLVSLVFPKLKKTLQISCHVGIKLEFMDLWNQQEFQQAKKLD